MQHLPTLVPLAFLGILGFFYALSTRLTSYHEAIANADRSGSETLTLAFLSLTTIMAAGSAVLIMSSVAVHYDSVPSTMSATWAFTSVIQGVLVPFTAIYARGLVDLKRTAGLAMCCLFTQLLGIFLSSQTKDILSTIAAAVLFIILLLITVETRRLGHRSGARTPWPILALLTVSATAGLILAILHT